MKLNNQPKTFVIALKNHEISERQLTDCLISADKFNWQIEIFWGVNGRIITDKSWIDIGVKPLYHKSSMSKPGTWGCFFSHWALWNKCLDLKEPIIILEHDAIITDYWSPIELKYLTKLHEYYKQKAARKWTDPDSGLTSPSTHAYCLTPDHAKKLIDFSKNVGAFATDRMIGDKVVPFIHLGRPSLIDRQNSYSTTENL